MLTVAMILSEQLVQVVNQLGVVDSSGKLPKVDPYVIRLLISCMLYCIVIRYEIKDSFPMSAVRGQAVAVS